MPWRSHTHKKKKPGIFVCFLVFLFAVLINLFFEDSPALMQFYRKSFFPYAWNTSRAPYIDIQIRVISIIMKHLLVIWNITSNFTFPPYFAQPNNPELVKEFAYLKNYLKCTPISLDGANYPKSRSPNNIHWVKKSNNHQSGTISEHELINVYLQKN